VLVGAMAIAIMVGLATTSKALAIQSAHVMYHTMARIARTFAIYVMSMAQKAVMARLVTARTDGKEGSAKPSPVVVRMKEPAYRRSKTWAANVHLAIADISVRHVPDVL